MYDMHVHVKHILWVSVYTNRNVFSKNKIFSFLLHLMFTLKWWGKTETFEYGSQSGDLHLN